MTEHQIAAPTRETGPEPHSAWPEIGRETTARHPLSGGIGSDPSYTLERQIALARREIGEARWAELQREWER